MERSWASFLATLCMMFSWAVLSLAWGTMVALVVLWIWAKAFPDDNDAAFMTSFDAFAPIFCFFELVWDDVQSWFSSKLQAGEDTTKESLRVKLRLDKISCNQMHTESMQISTGFHLLEWIQFMAFKAEDFRYKDNFPLWPSQAEMFLSNRQRKLSRYRKIENETKVFAIAKDG